jgi:hypothetical protein
MLPVTVSRLPRDVYIDESRFPGFVEVELRDHAGALVEWSLVRTDAWNDARLALARRALETADPVPHLTVVR